MRRLYARLAGAILYADPARRARASTIASNRLAQPGLWALRRFPATCRSCSLQIAGSENLELARQLVNAHVYCRMKGLDFDLVIWNEERGGYRQALQDEIMGSSAPAPDAAHARPARRRLRALGRADQPRGPRADAVGRARRAVGPDGLARGAARRRQARCAARSSCRELVPTRAHRTAGPGSRSRCRPRTLDNGIGGFAPNGTEYVIAVAGAQTTPAPWVNVIANPQLRHASCPRAAPATPGARTRTSSA